MRFSLNHSIVLAAAVLLCGCAFSPHLARRTTPRVLAPLAHDDTVDHIAYMGSDAAYHYFYRVQIPGGVSYKIPVSELSLKQTFPLGHGKPYVVSGLILEPNRHQ